MQTHERRRHLSGWRWPRGLLMDLGGKALYMGWLGARGFRDFSRLPPVQENREQPEDPRQLFFADF